MLFVQQKNKETAPTPPPSVPVPEEPDEPVSVSISPHTAQMSAQVSVLTSFPQDDHGGYLRDSLHRGGLFVTLFYANLSLQVTILSRFLGEFFILAYALLGYPVALI